MAWCSRGILPRAEERIPCTRSPSRGTSARLRVRCPVPSPRAGCPGYIDPRCFRRPNRMRPRDSTVASVRSLPLRALSPIACAAPMGATPTSATLSTLCAFCGHPPGAERTRHAELATRGARGLIRERSRAWRLWTPRTFREQPFGQGSNRGVPAGEAAGLPNPQCFGLKPSPPDAPPIASAAPMGATPIPASPSILCAFCGRPQGTEPAILGRASHKRRKGLNPRAEPCVASIDAANLQGGALRAGLEPWSSSRRSRRPTESSVLWFGALPSGRSPDRVRGAYGRHPNPRPALDPLRLLRPSSA